MIKIIVVVSAVIGILRYFICKKENRIYLLETSASLFWGAAKYCGCCLGIGILSAVVYVKFIPAEDDNIENIIINCWCLLFVVALILIIFIFALMIIRTIYFLLNKLWPTGATQSVHTMQPTGATQSTQATPSAWREQTVVTVADMLTSDNGNTSQSKQEGTIPLFFEEETDTRKETETVDENQASSSYRGLRWQICGLAGDYAGESFLIDGTLQIGRNPNAQVAYSPNSKRISKLHCQLLEDDGRIYIRDENSTNGTFLGKGIRLEPEVNYCLEEDDVFYLAEVEQRFCLKKG